MKEAFEAPEIKPEEIPVEDFASYTEVLAMVGEKKVAELEGTPEQSAALAKLQLFGANNEFIAPDVADNLEA